jgi:hypothetical protein
MRGGGKKGKKAENFGMLVILLVRESLKAGKRKKERKKNNNSVWLGGWLVGLR